MTILLTLVKSDNEDMVHAVLEPSGFLNSDTQCGLHLQHTGKGKMPYYLSNNLYHSITCKRCLAALGKNHLAGERIDEKPGETFYEVRMKNGDHEFIFDATSAQGAAEEVENLYDIPLCDIEYVNVVQVIKVVKPTITFEE